LKTSTGIQVEGHPVADVFALTPQELAALSFHNPAAFRVDPATVTTERIEARAANFRTLAAYDQGLGSAAPKLARRLSRVRIPILVAWGESDRVVDEAYGRAYAEAFPNARFELIAEAGHLPQIERPERLLTLVRSFAISTSTNSGEVQSGS
jgi:pimeloyl-ACP methyl ester carboxylesterase